MPVGSFSSMLASAAQLTAVAVPKAVGIIGDDIAANTKQLLDLPPGRNFPALFKVVKGSLLNKAVLIPAATVISWAAPWAVLPLLAVGGFFLTAEAMEQMRGKGHGHDEHKHEEGRNHEHGEKRVQTEKEKVAGALKIDVILSAEITVLTLSVVAGAPILTQLAVMAATGVALTGILYGIIGGVINMDDAGKWLAKREGDKPLAKAARAIGRAMSKSVPPLMKAISVIGTAALFMVGGELLLAGIPGGSALLSAAVAHVPALPLIQPVAGHILMAAAGLAASLVSYPVMEKLEGPLGKLGDYLAAHKAKLFTRKAPANDNAAPIPEQTPAQPALANLPDVKADMNAAAAPKADAANAPAPAPVPAPKPPKIVP